MTTTALSWFYCKPETTCYEVAERVRTTFWEARLTALWLDCVSADSPYHLRGHHGESRVQMEWIPGHSFVLRTTPTDQPVAETVTRVLKLKPAFRYRDTEGAMVWEWHTGGGEKRWQEIQGKPGYHAPVRLTR
ncbi:MAG: hypothetical protein HY784_05725 [Chloroflexi bacterium]|nr:hypothetical protein [Chloroflexota bacterium]